jgi:hypothetical protein
VGNVSVEGGVEVKVKASTFEPSFVRGFATDNECQAADAGLYLVREAINGYPLPGNERGDLQI